MNPLRWERSTWVMAVVALLGALLLLPAMLGLDSGEAGRDAGEWVRGLFG